jgi:hypothetical protein
MKSKVLIFSVLVMLQSCATPRYSYYFDHQPISARKQNPIVQEVEPFHVDPASLSAASQGLNPISVLTPTQTSALNKKVLRGPGQNEMKMLAKATLGSSTPGERENKLMATAKDGKSRDLRLASIFGAAGLVAVIIGGSPLNVLGGIAILVGLVFFVRWIIRR